MATVRITGWKPGFLLISGVKILRGATGEGFASAKERMDRLVEGRGDIVVDFHDDNVAANFLRDVQAIGAVAAFSQDWHFDESHYNGACFNSGDCHLGRGRTHIP